MNDQTTQHRDDALGAALRSLDVPEHRPGFERELRRRLAAEGGRRRRRIRLLVPAAAAAGAAVALVAIGIPGTKRSPSLAGPRPAGAALVQARLRSAMRTVRSLSGVLVVSGPAQGAPQRWQFALDAAGDVRLEGPAPGEVVTYDARAGVARSAQRSSSIGGTALFYAERDGVAPGPPDEGPPTWLLPDELADFVRAAVASADPRVQAVRYDGRPAWRLTAATTPNTIVPDSSADHVEITVDRRTGVPLRVVETKRGSTLRELRIEHVHVDPLLARASFRLAFPAGAEVMRSDDGFRRVGLADAARLAGYAPLVPAWLPPGFHLAGVAVADEAAATGAGGANPPSLRVVSLAYRRGLDRLVVTTRLRGGAAWQDPLASAPGFADREAPLALATGALAGSDAHVVVEPRTSPHVWALTRKLVVTVAGDLDRAELVHVAGSLRPRRPA